MKQRKVALVTGGTSGVGLSIVRKLIEQNYYVVFVGTSEATGRALVAGFNVKSKRSEFVPLDLSDLRAVKAFADSFVRNYSRLDLLANIAGAIFSKRQITVEGFEKTFAIGYLSAYVLSTQLEPLLKITEGARIVNVAAQVKPILTMKLDFENLDFSKNFNSFKVSMATVHAKTVLTDILAEKLSSQGIDVNSFDPGFVSSKLSRNMPLPFRLLGGFFALFFSKTTENGVYVCSDSGLVGISGRFFTNQQSIHLKFDSDYKERLLQTTNEMLKNVLQISEERKNYKVGWLVPDKIAALTHFHSEITEQDIIGVFTETQKLLEKATGTFQIIIDNRLASRASIYTLEELQRMSPFLSHPLLEHVVIVKPDHIVLSPEKNELEIRNGVYLKNVSSVEEAVDFLDKRNRKFTRSKMISPFFPDSTV